MPAVRTLVLWCHDWPVVAAGIALHEPAIVLYGNSVMACSPAARSEGIAEGMRRREAQARCPELRVERHDPARDARAFEPVVAALETLTPRIEITQPGSCAFATRGPSRYFGGDDALAARVMATVAGELQGKANYRVGVADGPFAAALAARSIDDFPSDPHELLPPLVIEAGRSPAFLASFPITALRQPTLTDVVQRLGPRTLGDLAALPTSHVVGRFGEVGRRAHRLAQGLDDHTPLARVPPLDFTTSIEIDPPADRIDTVAFTAKALADDLHWQLDRRGLGCIGLQVTAETDNNEPSNRYWTATDPFSATAMAERVRWQLEGWLGGSAAERPTAGITLLRLAATAVIPAQGRQLQLWGEAGDNDVRIRAIARLEGLLGLEAVTVLRPRGGRGVAEQLVRVPTASVGAGVAATTSASTNPLDPPEPATAHPRDTRPPWPGRVPTPLPAQVHPHRLPVEVVDQHGQPVAVTSRGMPTADPAGLAFDATTPKQAISSWAGPWPVDERWWAPTARLRCARFQVITEQGIAHLLTLEKGRWWIEATYD